MPIDHIAAAASFKTECAKTVIGRGNLGIRQKLVFPFLIDQKDMLLLLIIDDLGTEMPGQFVTASLYSLLNDRMLEGKPMVISTNLNVQEMSRRYSPQIASRLHGGFLGLTFVGEDIRIKKSKEW